MIDSVLSHLEALVAFDTTNPPRAIDTGGIFDYLRAQLSGFDCAVQDHGAGAVSMLAVRGAPRRLFNVHLDTVPAAPNWGGDPHRLRVSAGRAIGLGACDIKGAAACLLAVARQSTGDLALLFSTDEEGNDARCIRAFLEGPQRRRFEEAVVAEPTGCEAVLAHRGLSSLRVRFAGRSGHASGSDAAAESAVHQAVRWGTAALAVAAAHGHERFGGLTGLRFNIGRIEGGIKGNMIAAECELRAGFRPLPSMSTDALHATLRKAAPGIAPSEYSELFRGPPLPSGDLDEAERRRLAARDLAEAMGLPIGHAVDFWTEASLFSAAGMTALVYGPGDIAQAHAADEWVATEQLARAAGDYGRLLGAVA